MRSTSLFWKEGKILAGGNEGRALLAGKGREAKGAEAGKNRVAGGFSGLQKKKLRAQSHKVCTYLSFPAHCSIQCWCYLVQG